MNRQAAVAAMLAELPGDAIVVSTTGLISRELFAQDDRDLNFYMLGSMGLAAAVGLGLALLRPDRLTVVLDGDGSALMSLGSLPLVVAEQPQRLLHLVLDNESYESTGGQRSISAAINLDRLGKAIDYAFSQEVASPEELRRAIAGCLTVTGPSLIVAKVSIDPGLRVPPRVSLHPDTIRDRLRAGLVVEGER